MMRAPESDRDRRIERIGLAASLLVVGVLAVIRLPGESMWLDEAYSRSALNDFWLDLRTFKGTMVLYTGLLRMWAIVSTATWWLRVPSVLAGVATLFVFRPIARRVGGSRLVALALPLMALSIGFLWAATDMRTYSLEILLTVIAWYCYLRADVERGLPSERTWWRLLAVTGVLGVLSHGLFVVQLVPIALVATVAMGTAKAARKLAPTVVLSGATLGVFLLLGTSTANGTYVPGGPSVWAGSAMDLFLSSAPLLKLILVELLAAAVVLAYWRGRSGSRRSRSLALVAPSWSIVPIVALGVISVASPTFNPRYVLPVIPGIALALGTVGVAADDRIRRRAKGASRLRLPVWSGSIALVVLALVTLVTASYPEKQDWRGAVTVVASQARATDGIVFADRWNVSPELTRPAFEATWAERSRATTPIAVSPARPLGRALPFDVPLTPPVIFERMAPHPRVWIVEYRLGKSITDEITGWRGFSGYSEVSRWHFDGGIQVTLWQRDP